MDTQTSNTPSPLPVLSTLPAVIPPTSRLNFIRTWWQRSDQTAAIAETRLLHHALQPTEIFKGSVIGKLVQVALDNSDKNQRIVNTLYLRRNPDGSSSSFDLDTENTTVDTIKEDLKASKDKNLVICHGYGAGKKLPLYALVYISLTCMHIRSWLFL